MIAPPRISQTAAIVVACALSAMTLGILIPLGWTVVLPYAITGIAPADWSWAKIGVAVVALVGGFAYLGWTIYRQFATVIADDGVTVPTLRGRRFIAWSEVRRVGNRGFEVLLAVPAGEVSVNLACYRDADAVTAYIQEKLTGVAEKNGRGSAA